MSIILDGFWLPRDIRQKIITSQTSWITEQFQAGRPTNDTTSGSVAARWPRFTNHEWKKLIDLLSKSRIPATLDYFQRMQIALEKISERFTNPQDSLTITALNTIPAYTGYSTEMIRFTLGSLNLIPVNKLEKITRLSLPDIVRSEFVKLKDHSQLEGRIRFYGTGIAEAIRKQITSQKPFSFRPSYPNMVVGFAAGNVIGTSNLISLLAQISALVQPNSPSKDRKYPSVLIKNSRQEPIFTPILFSAIEEIDPSLVNSIGIMIWDYNDTSLQEFLISKSDLVIAAAADFTIAEIDQVIRQVQKSGKKIRFHRHGHKVSFSTIGKDYLTSESMQINHKNIERIHLTTLLSAVDSIYWDQNGCLSSRIHFVERGDSTLYDPYSYGKLLAEKIRILSVLLPRGKQPLHNLHNRFDKYSALTATGYVHLCSRYEDDFLVVVDERTWSPSILKAVINDCIERTIIVRPVDNIDDVPNNYLKWLPKNNLQTMSVAIDGPDHSTWSQRFTNFVDLLGRRGITGIRSIGRGPFPQLTYSWDGYLPLDLSHDRSKGYFTTVEFDNNLQHILEIYHLYASQSGFFH